MDAALTSLVDQVQDMKTNMLLFYVTMLFLVLYMYVYIWTVLRGGMVKGKFFTKEFMSQFNDEWAEAFPGETEAPAGGLPDDGNGYFA